MLKQGYFLVKQVLSPLQIGAPDHPHDMPAGMQRERSRLLLELHLRFGEQMVSLPPIAGMAAGDQIFPG